mgnify:FL=1
MATNKIDNNKAKELKKDFPILKNNLIYLDNASTTQKPRVVIDSIKDFYENKNANIHRGVYKLSNLATKEYENSKKVIADFINSNPEEIIYTRGTTESINLLSYTIKSIIKTGKDEILLTELEHHSNLVPWQEFAKRNNFKLKFIALKKDFTLDLEDAKNKITEKTAILSISHISNSLGTVNPIKKIVELAKKNNVISIIDAAQSAGHMKLDVKDIGCDFLAFSGHKMLGPTGIGVLYGRKNLLEKLHPFNFGGDMIEKVSYELSTYSKIPEKFEAGTQNIEGAIALTTAINYLNKIKMENIESWEKELTEYTIEKLKQIPEIKLYNPGQENSSGIISFTVDDIHPHDIASMMDEENIAIRGGHHCTMPLMKKLNIAGTARISLYFYNTKEDVDKTIIKLKDIIKKFR